MEIIRKQDKGLSLLEKARQELAAFNRRSATPEPVASALRKPQQAHGDRILYCSKVPQGSAALILKIQEKGAEITDVIARHKAPVAKPSGSAGKRENSDLRALLLGNYQGCPHCDNEAIVLCTGCGCLSCIADDAERMTCPVCGHQGRVVCSGINLEFARQKAAQQASSQTLLPKGPAPLSLPGRK
ncbi:TerY-C metal binding domain-containing protein [uncultured Pseudomonas sp.]|uniref:TerY-C metal binding domain-containing protein n=1 Tax=uncultured Pseudomonas sp. TaxID=114707 RepID=UPI00261282DC|nr:TerY-C metal binding domain-containing protein [uncultured Pseudomonas sp.]